MIGSQPRALILAAAVGAALVGGAFFAFSSFVMPALRRLPPAEGVAAMQSINKQAPASPLFMAALFGMALLSIGLVISSLTRLNEPSARYQLIGCGLYLVCVVLTAAYHVPKNNALGQLDPNSAAAADAWRHYLTGWIALNHVRAVAPLASSVFYALALRAA